MRYYLIKQDYIVRANNRYNIYTRKNKYILDIVVKNRNLERIKRMGIKRNLFFYDVRKKRVEKKCWKYFYKTPVKCQCSFCDKLLKAQNYLKKLRRQEVVQFNFTLKRLNYADIALLVEKMTEIKREIRFWKLKLKLEHGRHSFKYFTTRMFELYSSKKYGDKFKYKYMKAKWLV